MLFAERQSIAMKVTPLISIIVTIYNIEKYIRKCIDSIVRQTYTNIQVILVDDGSTDASGEICDRYAVEDKRIQVIHKKNGGPVSARAMGLAVADGDYIGFVDGDDYIDAEFYEVLLHDIVNNHVDFVHTGFMCEREGCGTPFCFFETGRYELSPKTCQHFIEEGVLADSTKIQITPSIWSKLFKREFIQKCHKKVPISLMYGEDLVCLCICLLEGKSIYLHKTAMYHYIKRSGSLMNSGYTFSVIQIAELYHSLKSVFLEYDEYGYLQPYLENYIARTVAGATKKIGRCTESLPFYYLENIDMIKGKRIVIYGAGDVGQSYYTQLSRYSFCRIAGWIDKRYQQCHFDYAQVMSIAELKQLKYDAILIAIKNESTAKLIKKELVEEWGVTGEMIIWQTPKSIIEEI